MDVIVAQTAGFCFGVKRAVNMVYDAVAEGGVLYTYGPIVHNEQVISDLEAKGVRVLNGDENIASLEKGTVIIRAHGVSKEIYNQLLQSGMKIIDATCPFVKKIHNTVAKASKEGDSIVVIGSKNHPEVQGIVGWCESLEDATVIENASEADNLVAEGNRRITVVSQTTFQIGKFQELVEILHKKGYYINVVNTICNATEERQAEARLIASEVDAMIVIGGSKSSNTQKLYEICSCECAHTQYIQTVKDLDFAEAESLSRVGITAGASTPKKIIEEVQNYVRINF